MRYIPFLLLAAASAVSAAPVGTPLNPIPDLNQNSIREHVQDTEKQPAPEPQAPVQMSEEQLLQQPALLLNALDTAVGQQNTDNIRFLLPLYRRLPAEQQDPVLAEYAEAILLRADGRYDAAEQKLRQILERNPEFSPVRLQLALTQSQNGKQREAADEIARIRQTPDLPATVAQYLDQYEQYLNRECAWQFSGNAYYLQDNNVARAPEQRTYGAWQFNEPQSAHGIGYEFSAQKTTPVKGHWAARVQAALYGKFYWDAHAYDDLVARAEAGPVWRDAQQEIYAAPFYEQRWYGTEPFSRQTGGSIHYSRTLSPNWQMYAAWQSGYKQHNERTFLNGASHTGSLTLLYRTSPQQYFVMGIGGGQENAKDLSDAYRKSSLHGGWTRHWGSSRAFATSLNISVQRRNYRGPDIFNIQRRDTEYFTRLALSHNRLSWKGFTPRLNWTWSHIHSNHFYYRYNNHRVFLDIFKQF